MSWRERGDCRGGRASDRLQMQNDKKPLTVKDKSGILVSSGTASKLAASLLPLHRRPVSMIIACCEGKWRTVHPYTWRE